jgi:Kef-type K+ transport system membrane component KefB
MVPRGEITMIVALIGLETKVITQGVFVTLVLVGLITTVVTPIIYRNWLLRSGDCKEQGGVVA